MFKIFVGKIVEFVSFTGTFTSQYNKTRQRDLRKCPQHPKRGLSKGDTVWWALQNCIFLGGQRDIKRWAGVWSRVVQIWRELPCLSYELLATPQGACSARKRPVWTGRKSIGDTFFQTTMTYVINFFASFSVVKLEHVEGNTWCIGFPHLFIGFPSVMVVIANFWTRWWLRFAHGIGHTEQ